MKSRLAEKEMELSRLEDNLVEQEKEVERKKEEIDVKEEIIEEKAEELMDEGTPLSHRLSCQIVENHSIFQKRKNSPKNEKRSRRKKSS